jgi:hypothetical protein
VALKSSSMEGSRSANGPSRSGVGRTPRENRPHMTPDSLVVVVILVSCSPARMKDLKSRLE